jgi:phosphatidylglycerol:prolipoprotein diacylglycerol transferase
LFREPDVQLGFLWGGLTMGMLLCIPLMLGGIAILTYALSYEPKPKDG